MAIYVCGIWTGYLIDAVIDRGAPWWTPLPMVLWTAVVFILEARDRTPPPPSRDIR